MMVMMFMMLMVVGIKMKKTIKQAAMAFQIFNPHVFFFFWLQTTVEGPTARPPSPKMDALGPEAPGHVGA
jgi:hypothetical protein